MNTNTTGHNEAVGPTGSAASPSFVKQWVDEYRAREELYRPTMLTLPSGKTVKVARMPLHVLWTKGIVPDSLTARVRDWVEAIESDEPESSIMKDMAGLANDDLVQRYVSWVDMLDFVWCTCVKEPVFVPTEPEQNTDLGRLWVGDVELDDKVYLFSFVQGVDQTVEDFFRQQAAIVGALPDGEGLLDPSERLLWVERQGGRVVGVHDRPRGARLGNVHPGEDRRDQAGPDPQGSVEKPDDGGAKVQRGRHRSDAGPRLVGNPAK